jgi:hypothetical protein
MIYIYQLTANLRSMRWYFCFFMSWLFATIRIAILKLSWSNSLSSCKISIIFLRLKEIGCGRVLRTHSLLKTRTRNKLLIVAILELNHVESLTLRFHHWHCTGWLSKSTAIDLPCVSTLLYLLPWRYPSIKYPFHQALRHHHLVVLGLVLLLITR